MALKTMYTGMVNSPTTKLAQDIGPTDTIIYVENLDVFPPAPNLAVIGIDESAETIRYAAIDTAASTLTGCTRALQGVAKTWPTTTPIARNFTAYDYDTLRENVSSVNDSATAAQAAANTAQTTAAAAQATANTALTKANALNGGTKGQFLVKNSDTDGDAGWSESVKTVTSNGYPMLSTQHGILCGENGVMLCDFNGGLIATLNDGLTVSAAGGIVMRDGSAACGKNSVALGTEVWTGDYGEMVIGQCNEFSTGDANAFSATNNAFVIGNGADYQHRSNAMRVDYGGNMYLAGVMEADSIIVGSTPLDGGIKFKLSKDSFNGQYSNTKQQMTLPFNFRIVIDPTDGVAKALYGTLPEDGYPAYTPTLTVDSEVVHKKYVDDKTVFAPEDVTFDPAAPGENADAPLSTSPNTTTTVLQALNRIANILGAFGEYQTMMVGTEIKSIYVPDEFAKKTELNALAARVAALEAKAK